MSNDDAEYVKS